MSIDSLLKVDLRNLSELKIRELESGNDGYATGTTLRVLATTVDGKNNENIEYVPIKAKAGYLAGHTDPEFIATLPRFTMPQLPANRTYRMFPTSGTSILKSAGQDFVFKQVVNKIKQARMLLLKSLNEEFTPYEVPIADVLEIWRYVSYVSDAVPAGNISLGQIAQSLKEIKVDVARIAAGN